MNPMCVMPSSFIQALADLAFFHDYINEMYGLTNTKWVTFGGSYPGMLAAWV